MTKLKKTHREVNLKLLRLLNNNNNNNNNLLQMLCASEGADSAPLPVECPNVF